MAKRDGEKPSPQMPAGEYRIGVHVDAYDRESVLYGQLDTAEPNQLAVFHKLGRICHAIEAGEDAGNGTVTVTMHQVDAAYIRLAFARLLANSDDAGDLAALVLCLPVDQQSGVKSAKLTNELTEAQRIRKDMDMLAAAFKGKGIANPRTEAKAAIADQRGESVRTIERRLKLLNLSPGELMQLYSGPSAK